MKQPDLGKRIAKLRQAKGLTQGELAERCNLNTRTIQRIESAEVMPRSYTIKIIFKSLDYDVYNSFGKLSYMLDSLAYMIKNWLGQAYKYILELFNLKTNTMRKLMILSVPFLSIFLVLLLSGLDTNAHNEQAAKNAINEANSNFVKWFNSGQIDSIGLLYLEKSCMIPDNYREIHEIENIKGYYHFLYNTGFRFTENKSKSLIISDSIAIDRGAWKAFLIDELTGTYLTQWRLYNGKWYIENEMTNTDFIDKKMKE
jgi:transcriptional regulator with XRE-family HTH domain